MSVIRQWEIQARHGGGYGVTTGATPVVAVSEPDAGYVRVVTLLSVVNDHLTETIRISKFADPNYYEFANSVGSTEETYVPIDKNKAVNVANGESLTIALDDSPDYGELTWIASWTDVPIAE